MDGLVWMCCDQHKQELMKKREKRLVKEAKRRKRQQRKETKERKKKAMKHTLEVEERFIQEAIERRKRIEENDVEQRKMLYGESNQWKLYGTHRLPPLTAPIGAHEVYTVHAKHRTQLKPSVVGGDGVPNSTQRFEDDEAKEHGYDPEVLHRWQQFKYSVYGGEEQ
eukprot:TRINITY_DN849_c0_g1_i1.p1 TRINITY_DN849_c0_g1~~TRINITY_DN849_c0_g1_i1.p1  ORF type:complete len:166 (-),score=38.97 TRINITY_DN849_c0_g1_i1:54-551(-)